MDKIYYDFSRAMKKADELTEVAQNMRKSANLSFNREIDSIRSTWQGNGADIYINRACKLRDEIVDCAKRLEHTADTIRQVARRTYNTEKKAKEIANKRTYR